MDSEAVERLSSANIWLLLIKDDNLDLFLITFLSGFIGKRFFKDIPLTFVYVTSRRVGGSRLYSHLFGFRYFPFMPFYQILFIISILRSFLAFFEDKVVSYCLFPYRLFTFKSYVVKGRIEGRIVVRETEMLSSSCDLINAFGI